MTSDEVVALDRFIPILTQAGLVSAGEETSTPGMVAFPIRQDAIAQTGPTTQPASSARSDSA